MQLKFYLNKFLKVDNIENYTLKALKKLEDTYEEFKEKTNGVDPDFPGISFKTKGTKITVGSNVYQLFDSKPSSEGSYKKLEKMPPSINKKE